MNQSEGFYCRWAIWTSLLTDPLTEPDSDICEASPPNLSLQSWPERSTNNVSPAYGLLASSLQTQRICNTLYFILAQQVSFCWYHSSLDSNALTTLQYLQQCWTSSGATVYLSTQPIRTNRGSVVLKTGSRLLGGMGEHKKVGCVHL